MLLVATTTSFLLSLLGKFLADSFLATRIPVLGSFAGFQYAANSGVAFSITFPGHLQTVLIGVALLALAWAAWHAKTRWSRIAFGLIIGGALGNIADRIPDGHVTDFFQVGTFPIFNVADSCITIGVFLLLLEAVWVWWNR
ncbi:signal peptidase II [Candidatus Peribacteria bacterium]|nr:signal peptidase II [Candidatus Peribacteria bacterium]